MGHIIVTDSGVGGISVLRCLRALLPKARFVYFADDANFPYGKKNAEELAALAEQNYRLLTRMFDADAFVVACNTLTAAAIDGLRAAHTDALIIGCEPPIAPAATAAQRAVGTAHSASALVLMTETSRSSERLSARFSDKNAIFLAMPDLAQMIEADAAEADICTYVRGRVAAAGVKFCVVALGCTHYSLKKSIFERIFAGTPVFDAAEGVARQTVRLVVEKSGTSGGGDKNDANANSGQNAGSTIIMTSSGAWTAFPPAAPVLPALEKYVQHLEDVGNGQR